MISSKIFTVSLHYITNTKLITFNNACEQLRQHINKTFNNDNFKAHMHIVEHDSTIMIDRKDDPRVTFIVTIYATIEDNKEQVKRLREYIDNNIAKIELAYVDATLLRRRIY